MAVVICPYSIRQQVLLLGILFSEILVSVCIVHFPVPFGPVVCLSKDVHDRVLEKGFETIYTLHILFWTTGFSCK